MAGPDDAIVRQILAVERRWVQAHRELDIAVIREILAEDYMQIRPDGTVIGKKEALDAYQSGTRRWDFADSDDHRIAVYGDVAILIGRWASRGVNDGMQFDYTARFLAVYRRIEGEWRLAAEQSTPLAF